MKALDYFNQNYNCAESVLKSSSPQTDTSVATPFGGGIANTNHICGALTGGLMAIGIHKGRKSNKDSAETAKLLSANLIERFNKTFNGTRCNEISECDLTTDDGKVKFNLPERREKCKDFVKFVDEFLKEIL